MHQGFYFTATEIELESEDNTWPLGRVSRATTVTRERCGDPGETAVGGTAAVGAAAFAVFKWRGKMSHGLAEPIPGAPALTTSADWRPPAGRLRKAVTDFASWIESRRQEGKPYLVRQPGMLRELAEGLLLWLAFQL